MANHKFQPEGGREQLLQDPNTTQLRDDNEPITTNIHTQRERKRFSSFINRCLSSISTFITSLDNNNHYIMSSSCCYYHRITCLSAVWKANTQTARETKERFQKSKDLAELIMQCGPLLNYTRDFFKTTKQREREEYWKAKSSLLTILSWSVNLFLFLSFSSMLYKKE